jgi:hypothetical protein
MIQKFLTGRTWLLTASCTPLLLLVFCDVDQKKALVDMNELVPEKILDWTAVDEFETYDRESIFDYIDGAGEVYRQYDFRQLLVKRFRRADHPSITVELFDMGSSRDAFGVFSHSREGEGAGIGQGSEFRGGLLCFWKSRFFICIYAEKRTDETDNAVLELARNMERRIGQSGPSPELLNYLPEEGLIYSSIIYFHNQASLNYHYYLAENNILNLSDDTQAVIVRYKPHKAFLLCIMYDNEEQVEKSLQDFIAGYMPEAGTTGLAQVEEDQWVKVKAAANFLVIALEAPSAVSAEKLIGAATDKIMETADE